MRKIIALFIVFACAGYARAETYNPFFVGHKHQVGFSLGTGVNSGRIVPPFAQFVPFTELHVQYSVPSEAFYLPARLSMNLTQTVGFGRRYGWDWTSYSIPIIYITKDLALLYTRGWYFGAGAGAGFQAKENERIGSKLVFTFKVFTGYRLTDRLAGELYAKHFSNGNTAPENNSYAFYGIGFTWNF
ncbi:MAG: acyloxyacyl hydrolase [Alphaproteobacteria bacterium]|nr:acyloxyacyl hydrolase [Alphaproteobacteria bacterium]